MARRERRTGEVTGRIVGAGVDVIEVERVAKMEAERPQVFDRVFETAERDAARSMDGEEPGAGLARFFSLKEAALKALGTGWGQGIGWKDVRIARGAGNRVRVIGSAAARARMRRLGGRRFVADAAAGGGLAFAVVLLVA